MRLGEMRNEQAQAFGKPLDGVRVLAIASATPAAGHCPP
jgi:hypothetical protein